MSEEKIILQLKMEGVVDSITPEDKDDKKKVAGIELCNGCGETDFIFIYTNFLPSGIKEGDVLSIDITIDEKATAERKSEIGKLQQELLNKNK